MRIFTKAIVIAVLTVSVSLVAASVAPAAASAHEIKEGVDPGESGYINPDCVDGSSDAVGYKVGNKIVADDGKTEIDLDDEAPNGYVTHSGGLGKNSYTTKSEAQAATATVSGATEHYHKNTQESHRCWIESVLTIPRVLWIMRVLGGILLLFGFAKLAISFFNVSVPGVKSSGKGSSFGIIVLGVMMVMVNQLLLPIIFFGESIARQVFETLAGLF